jgi:hypothetical protein
MCLIVFGCGPFAYAGDLINQARASAQTPDRVTIYSSFDTARLPVALAARTISGVIYNDSNRNGVLDTSDAREGWLALELRKSGVVVASTTSSPDGSYEFPSVLFGTGYTISSVGGAVAGIGPIEVNASSSVALVVNVPVDPSGIVYDSVTRLPIADMRLVMTNAFGVALPDACFVSPAQQSQVTLASGFYRFDVVPGGDALCPIAEAEYQISVVSLSGNYVAGLSSAIVPQAGALDATTCTVDAVPGCVCEVQAQDSAPIIGQMTPYFLTFMFALGDKDVIHNHIPVDPSVIAPSAVSVIKASSHQIGIRGGAMAYTIKAFNKAALPVNVQIVDTMTAGFSVLSGTSRRDGVAVEPTITGRKAVFDAVTIPPAGSVNFTLKLRIPLNVGVGEYANLAAAVDPVTGVQVGSAGKAVIRIDAEAVFDCSDVIGKVFDDTNGNGFQDKGEMGIAGVRLASVNGALITTDSNGQYHVPCASEPDRAIGSNFILKLDTRTLPLGYALTTENPRDVRLTAGKLAKLNFGATAGRVVTLELQADAFVRGQAQLHQEWEGGLDELIIKLKEKRSTLRLVYWYANEDSLLVRERLQALRVQLDRKWRDVGVNETLSISSEVLAK